MVNLLLLPLLKRRRRRRYSRIEDGRFADYYVHQAELPGYGNALLSLFRAGTLGSQRPLYAALGNSELPALLLRGEQDTVATAAQAAELRKLVPRISFHEAPDAGHSVMLTHPQQAADAITRFLAQV